MDKKHQQPQKGSTNPGQKNQPQKQQQQPQTPNQKKAGSNW